MKKLLTFSVVLMILATITYGAVIVPIRPDFKPADVHFIVTHSDSVLLFVEESIFRELNTSAMPLIKGAFRIRDHSVLFSGDAAISAESGSPTPETITSPEQISFSASDVDDIAVISYTSGTTGFSKGVVLQHK